MILVDTNVLIDVMTNDPVWQFWSQQQLESAGLRDRVAINLVIYAELAAVFPTVEALDAALTVIDVGISELPRPAMFLAGKVFRDYRRRGGDRTGVLSDFFIGAHAAVLGAPLLTRDVKRYRTYFPTLDLIAPD